MAKYRLTYTEKAKIGIKKIKISGNNSLNEKLIKLLEEISEHPRTGTGHPEQLKGFKDIERWSRKINKEHRLVYDIEEEVIVIVIISAYGHYDD